MTTTPTRPTTPGSADLAAVAERYGTPVYVYDGDVLAANYRALRERLHPALGIFYSLKANPNVSVCGLLHAIGANAEVSSLAELRTALAATACARRPLPRPLEGSCRPTSTRGA